MWTEFNSSIKNKQNFRDLALTLSRKYLKESIALMVIYLKITLENKYQSAVNIKKWTIGSKSGEFVGCN